MAARFGDSVAAGVARLDNPDELERWSDVTPSTLSDLALVLRAVGKLGKTCVAKILGDFGFVVWDPATRTAIAACDAFAVKRLYYLRHDGLLALSSRAEALAPGERYDQQYLAELVAACIPSPELTVYAGVSAVSAGTMLVLEQGRLITHRYWSPDNVSEEPRWRSATEDAVRTCRRLLTESVRRRLGTDGATWSHLSGGIDSSSVVSLAQWLFSQGLSPHGLAGTVTYADSHGTGADEREYSNTVVAKWPVANSTLVDFSIWADDEYQPPRNDHPGVDLVFYPRDCRIADIVTRAGGRALLTGAGGDILFAGNMFFFADWIARGRVLPALREMARRAAMGRVSFWELAYRNAILPLLPRGVRGRLVRELGQMPPWVRGEVAARYELRSRAYAPLACGGRIGHKYRGAVAAAILAMGPNQTVGVLEDALDVRHPFLYRPLVEFALQLPAELCVQPHARKWVLREAMREILPENVRTRIGKGSPYGLLSWWTATRGADLAPLLQESILADMGIVDEKRLRLGLVEAMHEGDRRDRLIGIIHHTLAIEAWLQLRSGRWPRRSHGHRRAPTRSNHQGVIQQTH
jgi:asparagine synthase (glutamine-hydrolysing)